jgi:hypothetical protein
VEASLWGARYYCRLCLHVCRYACIESFLHLQLEVEYGELVHQEQATHTGEQ